LKINAETIKRLMSPNAYKNLDVFLEQMPLRAGYAGLIAGVACLLLACVSVMYVVVQAGKLMHLRADILKAEALKPTVPVIAKSPVADEDIAAFIKKMTEFYPQLRFTAPADGNIEIRAKTTDKYGAFREAVGHVFNGGKGWRIDIKSMCVGRECKNNNDAVYGAFKIHRLRVDKPKE
jgi:hypothetical protein